MHQVMMRKPLQQLVEQLKLLYGLKVNMYGKELLLHMQTIHNKVHMLAYLIRYVSKGQKVSLEETVKVLLQIQQLYLIKTLLVEPQYLLVHEHLAQAQKKVNIYGLEQLLHINQKEQVQARVAQQVIAQLIQELMVVKEEVWLHKHLYII